MAKGYIYVLSNPSMEGLYKVGRSINGGRKRAQELYQTGVPEPFKVEFEISSNNPEEDEAEIHDCLQDYRVNKSREFFRCELSEIVQAVSETCLYNYCLSAQIHECYVPEDCVGQYILDLKKINIETCTPILARALSYDITTEELKIILNRSEKIWAERIKQNREKKDA